MVEGIFAGPRFRVEIGLVMVVKVFRKLTRWKSKDLRQWLNRFSQT